LRIPLGGIAMKMSTAWRAMTLAGVLFATIGASPGSFAADVLIGAGRNSAINFNVARAICRQIQTANDGVTCEAQSIEGRDAAEPIAVLSGVRTGSIDIGIVPSDWQYHAFQGTGPFEFMDVKFDTIRSLFSLHSEAFTLVARRDSGIDRLDDLVGKRISIGNPGTNRRAIMDMVMTAMGWTRDNFQLVEELTELEQSLALCHNRVQAIVLTVAHPDAALAKTIELCDAKIIEVTGAEIDTLMATSGYLAATEVPGGSYATIGDTVKTFGVVITAVSSEDLADDDAYAFAKSVFDNLDKFKKLHPALRGLQQDRMVTDGLSAPIHPGAQRYFKERGAM
jgi:uncharacterized protein